MAESPLATRLVRRLALRRETSVRPHEGPVADPDKPLGVGGKSGALRAAIFGLNDGLLSNVSLIMAVAGASVPNRFILLTGLGGLLAGALSMGWGEYVSMTTQRELFERLLHIEAHELATEPEEEHHELRQIYEGKGFPAELARQVTEAVMRDPKVALETHAREELGLDPHELGSPRVAAVSSFAMFATGALIPLLPFVIGSGQAAILTAITASAVAIFAVGATMSLITARSPLFSGLRMLLGATLIASLTFGIGRLFHLSTGA